MLRKVTLFISCMLIVALFALTESAHAQTAAKPADPAAQKAKATPYTVDEIRKIVSPVAEAVKLWEDVQAAEAKYAAAKNDENKAALQKAHFAFAERVMFHVNTPGAADQLQDTKRYQAAYQSYKKVLEFDPAHAESKSRVQTIVNIYLTWGRPLP